MAGVSLFSALCLVLLQLGHLPVPQSPFLLLLGVWWAGLFALMLAGESSGRFRAGTLSFSKALWCNVGIVMTALLVPHPVRLLLLVAPLFGVLYTALHLDRAQMFTVAAVTWVSYAGGALLLCLASGVDAYAEWLFLLAFSGMLFVMVIMAGEVTALKTAFERRRDRLREAMEQLADLAMRDELTGLYNRRYIMDVLTRQKALADRGHVGFALCYCDLDHFKRINDRFGHQVGDLALKDFSDIALSVVRSADFVARLGGEEFLLVLIGADSDTASTVARRLCERSKLLAVIPGDPEYRVTVSVGVARFQPGERIEDVIQRSDRALYAAKAAGRDQIVLGD
jgi:diguanylate cyclase (GGDEF)-like protein